MLMARKGNLALGSEAVVLCCVSPEPHKLEIRSVLDFAALVHRKWPWLLDELLLLYLKYMACKNGSGRYRSRAGNESMILIVDRLETYMKRLDKI